MILDVAVIGAGVAGLTLAWALRKTGLRVLVLERALGVGGRCATRRVDGQPVDHGVAFLHGRDPRFLGALESVPDVTVLRGWPLVVDGQGVPCQPEAFDPSERRVAYREGVSRLPKHLAHGSEIRLGSDVVRLRRAPAGASGGGVLELDLETGERLSAKVAVLAMPVPQAKRLIDPLAGESRAVADARGLLQLVHMASCATVIARYPAGAPRPAWDARYPEAARSVHVVFHDSGKRGDTAALTLVIQGRSSFSRAVEGDGPECWVPELLREAADLVGPWVAAPAVAQPHLWRFARVHQASELAAPLLVPLEDGAALGFCGDGFSVSAGLEGAYVSGLALSCKVAEHLATRAAR